MEKELKEKGYLKIPNASKYFINQKGDIIKIVNYRNKQSTVKVRPVGSKSGTPRIVIYYDGDKKPTYIDVAVIVLLVFKNIKVLSWLDIIFIDGDYRNVSLTNLKLRYEIANIESAKLSYFNISVYDTKTNEVCIFNNKKDILDLISISWYRLNKLLNLPVAPLIDSRYLISKYDSEHIINNYYISDVESDNRLLDRRYIVKKYIVLYEDGSYDIFNKPIGLLKKLKMSSSIFNRKSEDLIYYKYSDYVLWDSIEYLKHIRLDTK